MLYNSENCVGEYQYMIHQKKMKYSEKNESQSYFAHHTFLTDCPQIKPWAFTVKMNQPITWAMTWPTNQQQQKGTKHSRLFPSSWLLVSPTFHRYTYVMASKHLWYS
jgi:hypothetical protein